LRKRIKGQCHWHKAGGRCPPYGRARLSAICRGWFQLNSV